MTSIDLTRFSKSFGNSVAAILSLSLFLSLSGCSSENSPVEESVSVSEEAVVEEVANLPEDDSEATVAAEDTVDSTTAIEEDTRITPEVVAAPIDSATTEALAVDAGAKLYEVQCKVCHAQGLLNAPKYGDKAAWMPAMAKERETLYTHSAKGFNKMPAQAINGVSEAQVKAAVDYMLAAVS